MSSVLVGKWAVDIDSSKIVMFLLDQNWHKECEIIPYHIRYEGAKPIVAIRYSNVTGTYFLRYSCGPKQGFFWDSQADDFLEMELALIALSKAPIPTNFRKETN